jgi:hypothetical protein
MRDTLIWQLEHDAAAHESGHFDQIGMHFDTVADSFSLLSHVLARDSPESKRLNTAMAFWDGWIGAGCNHWQNRNNITEADWPLLARRLAADLAADRDPSDPTIQECFDVSCHGQP